MPRDASNEFSVGRRRGQTFDDIADKTGKLGAGDQIMVQIAGRGGVPADAATAILNVTAVRPTDVGYLE